MARDIPIGNGNLLVCFDERYQIRDWYYPLIGQENHTAGHGFYFGVSSNGRFSWVHDDPWERHLDYEEDTLATAVTLVHPEWGLTLYITDVVDFHANLLIRRFRIHNRSDAVQDVQLFLHHDFHLYGVDVGDTVFYDPMTEALIHYKARRYFLMGGQETPDNIGIHSWAIGRKEVGGMEGTWRDAEDSRLEGNAIAQGSVDSTISLGTRVHPGSQETLYAWVAAGQSLEEVRTLNGLATFETPEALIDRTRSFWRLWLNRRADDFEPNLDFDRMYNRSLLIVRTNVDDRGGIIAGNDSDIMSFSRDTYSYVWPRDGAWVARALDIAGYSGLASQFFSFCAEVIDPGGYFLHKYNPDGSLASSWHPWVIADRPALPIQEDETGTVLWALWQHFVEWRNVEQAESWFRRLILPAGQFLADFRHPDTGLPWPSWDLWEERRGIHTYTVASVYAGLMAAGHFARAFGEESRADEFCRAAEEIQQAALKFLVDPKENRFLRGLNEPGADAPIPDPTADSSLLLVPQLGLIAPDHPVMVNTARHIHERLQVAGPIGGQARYEGDAYHRRSADAGPGNPWFISSLWYADYLLMTAESPDDLTPAEAIIRWTLEHAMPSGVLAEQLDSETGAPLSVSPLTWSHAALILTIERYRRTARRWGGRAPRRMTLPSVGY